MSFNFDKFKIVDDYTKKIVDGYIHTSQLLLPDKQNAYYIIPPLVGYVIIAYYHNPEYFALFPESVTMNDKKDTIKYVRPKGSNPDISIFGNTKISQKLYANKFIWTFKISEPRSGLSLAIGIDANSSKNVKKLFDCNGFPDGPYYAYEAFCSKYSPTARLNYYDMINNKKSQIAYGICYAEVDMENILKMELNTKNKTLRYYVNKADQGIAIEEVMMDKDKEYTLAISIDSNVTLQLLRFEQTHE